MVNIGIVGGTGYTGIELMRILANHPEAQIKVITSRSHAGTRVSNMFPNLRGYVDTEFTVPTAESYKGCDLVFFATPNAVAMHEVEKILDSGVRVIDLAADRQEYICQSQSLNVFFPANVSKQELHAVHMMAWKKKVKTLYYLRSEAYKRAENVSDEALRQYIFESIDEGACLACEG